ncbi:hypothetical protein OPS25_10425 [Alteromonas ponticola]|uniref:DNA gyrase subunit B n=1 Tax=Alteromonas aquimaris TaxID=2998417 RepID=A0ABT3P816_9ALTE|nr:hypothetical protein [Alteromonas aquimaris]MCW8108907.1 hypothetical protein [Alteromonas aquimaris]
MMARSQFGKSALFTLILLLLMLAYPLVVYLHIDEVSPRWYGAVLLTVLLIRSVLTGARRVSDWLIVGLVSVYCLSIMFFDSQLLVKFYPVLMSVGMGLLFIASLFDSETLIEKFAKAGGTTPPPQAQNYLRVLTLCWGGLLLLNGLIAAYTAWFASLSAWAVYNGVISYLIFACFAAMEWGYRGYYKKRHNIIDDKP